MEEENVSIITQSMVISGIVECQGRVVLEGILEGTFSGKILNIGTTGKISGDIKATDIDCSGYMEGRVVTDSLALRRTGRHVGTVETRKLAVDPGASLDCALQSGSIRGSASVENVAVNIAKPIYDLSPLLSAFHEGVRPCCMDVPWSARLEVYNQLLELLEKGKPLIKVTGEQGFGKTNLVEKLRRNLPASYEVQLVKDSTGSVAAVLLEVAQHLDIDGIEAFTQSELLTRIKVALEARRRAGQRVLLLIDDAETMHPATMEGIIRSLTKAYGEEGDEVLQLILFGSQEMVKKMVATTIEYFEDETNCQLNLEPLNIKDTADYIRFSLQLANAGGSSYSTALFPYETIRKIHSLSHGNIAAVNRLADKALRAAHTAGASEVSAKFI